MDTNLPANARGMGLIPGPGKITHAAGQLSPHTTSTELECLEPVLCNKGSHGSGKPGTSGRSSPCSPQLQKVHV